MMNKLHYPKVAIIPVTYRCNSRCVMCNIWKDDQKDMDKNFLWEVFEDQLLSENIESVNLTGGELTLREDVDGLIRGLLERCPKLSTITVNSNGFLPNRVEKLMTNILALKKSYRFNLLCYLSIDGLEETHDIVRGVKGSYSKVWSSIEILKNLQKEHDFNFSINFTINRLNYLELDNVYNELTSKNIMVDFTYGMRSPMYFQNDDSDSLNLDDTEIRHHVASFIRRIKNEGFLTNSISYYSNLIKMMEGDIRKVGCIFANEGFFLHPSGDVYRCWVYDKKIGNVYDSSFTEIWAGELAKDSANEIRERCKTCYNNCYAQYKRIDSVNNLISQTQG